MSLSELEIAIADLQEVLQRASVDIIGPLNTAQTTSGSTKMAAVHPLGLAEDFKPRQLPTWLMSSFEAIARSAKKYLNFRRIFRCWAAGCNRMGWLVRV